MPSELSPTFLRDVIQLTHYKFERILYGKGASSASAATVDSEDGSSEWLLVIRVRPPDSPWTCLSQIYKCFFSDSIAEVHISATIQRHRKHAVVDNY